MLPTCSKTEKENAFKFHSIIFMLHWPQFSFLSLICESSATFFMEFWRLSKKNVSCFLSVASKDWKVCHLAVSAAIIFSLHSQCSHNNKVNLILLAKFYQLWLAEENSLIFAIWRTIVSE